MPTYIKRAAGRWWHHSAAHWHAATDVRSNPRATTERGKKKVSYQENCSPVCKKNLLHPTQRHCVWMRVVLSLCKQYERLNNHLYILYKCNVNNSVKMLASQWFVSFQSADPQLCHDSSCPPDVSLMWWCDAALASLLCLVNVMFLSSMQHYIWLWSAPLGLMVSHIICNVNLAVHVIICLSLKQPVLHLWFPESPH